MWEYDRITREEFDAKKAFTGQLLLDQGCVETEIGDSASGMPVYKYEEGYYRVNEILYDDGPYVQIEYSDDPKDVENDTMEEADLFPYYFEDDEIEDEVRNTLKYIQEDTKKL